MFAFGKTALFAGTCLLSDICVVVVKSVLFAEVFCFKKMCELVLERECVFDWNIIGWSV